MQIGIQVANAVCNQDRQDILSENNASVRLTVVYRVRVSTVSCGNKAEMEF
jgi:hypothetical protein